MLLSRLSELLNGLVRYGNPLHIALKRAFSNSGLITISDRQTGVTVIAATKSYHMFGETWYSRDYDVPGCLLRPGDIVIDIGANQGFFSCYAAAKGTTIYAYEPFPESFARLQSNTARNGFSANVIATQAAVSSSTGKAVLWSSSYLGGGANTIVSTHLKSIPDSSLNKIEVDAVSIDSVLSAIPGEIRLCKVDCEGAEYDILANLSNPSRIDSFAIEYHPEAYRLSRLVETMMSWGTHQISFANNSHMLYAVRNSLLSEFAESRT